MKVTDYNLQVSDLLALRREPQFEGSPEFKGIETSLIAGSAL